MRVASGQGKKGLHFPRRMVTCVARLRAGEPHIPQRGESWTARPRGGRGDGQADPAASPRDPEGDSRSCRADVR